MLQNPLSAPKNFFLLVLLLCTTGIYFIMLLITLPHLRDAAGGMYPLDMRPLGYDSTYISSLFDALGDDGRRYYLTKQLPLDMLYPGLFALTYTLSIATLQTALRWDSRPNRILRLAPVLTGVFDYLENFTALLLLALYPKIPGFYCAGRKRIYHAEIVVRWDIVVSFLRHEPHSHPALCSAATPR